MPYTLTKGLLWFAIALVLGVVVGWLLRSIKATGQVRRARHARHDAAELEQLRGRVANLEPLVGENARLKAELAELGGAPVGAAPVDLPDAAADTGSEAAIDARVPADEPEQPADVAPAGEPARAPEADAVEGQGTAPSEKVSDVPSAEPVEPPQAFAAVAAPVLDLAGAAAVLGRTVTADDLTVVEGIGPAIAELCQGIGVHTWADLAGTEVSLLRTMLADAGPQFSMHQPDSWPQQAALLATGQWQEFQELVEQLDGGKLVE
ncbi:MAG TPA: hypothetical protein VNQ73_13180 [Ilumatobacter sp.]|nr:hypothetical protein [Ilumatobacter sp.]